MLVDEQYPNIFSIPRESCKCILNLARLRLLVDDQEVALGIWRVRDMTDASEKQACDGTA